MRILVLEDAKFDGRYWKKGAIAILGSDLAHKFVETGKAIYEDTNRSVGLKKSHVPNPEVRIVEAPVKQKKSKKAKK